MTSGTGATRTFIHAEQCWIKLGGVETGGILCIEHLYEFEAIDIDDDDEGSQIGRFLFSRF